MQKAFKVIFVLAVLVLTVQVIGLVRTPTAATTEDNHATTTTATAKTLTTTPTTASQRRREEEKEAEQAEQKPLLSPPSATTTAKTLEITLDTKHHDDDNEDMNDEDNEGLSISKRVLTPTEDSRWVPLREERTKISIMEVHRASAASVRPIVLLTSYYNAKDPARASEIDSSLEENIRRGVFDEVHVLYNPETDNIPQALKDAAAEEEGGKTKAKKVVFVGTKSGAVSGLEDRFGVSASSAYLYSDFFAYANKALYGKIVVVSNTDIVFDSTVHNIRDALSTQSMWGHAFALSRVSPPCPGVRCKMLFCKKTLCLRNVASYDAFAFVSPVPEAVVLATNHKQDQKGAENIVVAELDHYGFTVVNPCKSVTLTHRHCARNVTSYVEKPILNDGRYGGARVVKLKFDD